MSSRYAIEYLPAAQRDLSDLLDYIARDNPRAARDCVDRLERTVGRLAQFPKSGRRPRDPRLDRLGYRVLVVDDYLVFYVIRRRTVQVRRVIHGARRFGFLL